MSARVREMGAILTRHALWPNGRGAVAGATARPEEATRLDTPCPCDHPRGTLAGDARASMVPWGCERGRPGTRIQLTQSDKRREIWLKIFSSPASAPRHTSEAPGSLRTATVSSSRPHAVYVVSLQARKDTPPGGSRPTRSARVRISHSRKKTVSTKLLEAQALGSMATTAPKTADYTPSRRSLELCPRSYDLVERAELDTLCVQLEGLPTVRSPSDRRRASNLPTFFP